MPRARQPLPDGVKQPGLLSVADRLVTAPCVPAIRQEVAQWRAKGWAGVTATTRRLLNWWFISEHRTPQGRTFRYHDAQREAIETLIYLHEVKRIRRRAELLTEYAKGHTLMLPAVDPYPRYAFKLATGTGKTKVMALAIAWHYFNAVNSEGDDYATTFLLIAPNVIVLERLASDFAGGRIFSADPVIPPDLRILWDLDVYVRGDGERMQSAGALYLTNIQQIYDRGGPSEEPNPVAALLGPMPPATLQTPEGFIERIARRGDCLVLNDEAHHTHDQAAGWNSAIAALHERLGEHGLSGQFDFSATPRQPDGSLFTWTIVDYPLKQAIIDRVVKRPIKGVAQGIAEAQSDKASVRYEAYLVAAVERWQEYREHLGPFGKKPILFLMLYDTKSADEVAVWLRARYPDAFGGDQLLVIHTNRSGEVSNEDLETARQAARQVDEETSPVQCIVSVLMLREGWDVNNVTVVVGLRPFTSRANILPEQAVGRGLRLMFRDQGGYDERVDIIGNDNFMQVVADLEKTEGISLDTFDYGKKKTLLTIPAVQVLTERIGQYEIEIPVLSARLERRKETRQAIEDLTIDKLLLRNALTVDTTVAPPESFTYEGRDVISDEVLVERTYTMPQAQTASEIVAFYTQTIAHSLKVTGQFAVLAPKIEQFLRLKAFGQPVTLDSPALLQALNKPHVLNFTEKVFFKLLRPRLIEEHEPVISSAPRRLSTTPPFPWSGKLADVGKTVFDLTPCDNEFEMQFAHFLNDAPDVAALANLGNLPQKLSLEYLDAEANLRYYEPDFVARDTSGGYWLLETKGRVDLEVERKAARAQQWCEDVTTQTGVAWGYLTVPQKEFDKLAPVRLGDLVGALTAGAPLFVE
jgi:type III restriction enzyme